MISVFDAQATYQRHATDFEAAALRILRSGRYILGEEVDAFEHEAADYLGTAHAISCASGTDALTLALRALGIGPGDHVLTTTFTFFATVSAILTTGATPVLCDIDPTTHNLDPHKATEILAGKSVRHQQIGVYPEGIKAIIPVHLYGHPTDHAPLQTTGLPIIEDAAQAFGASIGGRHSGTTGTLGCHSFFPTKNLGGFGDGGMVNTDDDDLADRLRMLRHHGAKPKYVHHLVGTNSRLDTLQAALLRVRLRHLQDDLSTRGRLAHHYDEALSGSLIRTPPPTKGRTYNLYVIRVPNGRRDHVAQHLTRHHIESAVHYPVPIHLQPAVAHLGYNHGDFPQAEAASREVLTLPLYPMLELAAVERIARLVLEAIER